MDSAVIVALVALGGTFVATGITQVCQVFINKRNREAEREARSQEFYDKHRAEVIEGYIKAVSIMCKSESGFYYDALAPYLAEIYLYVDEENWPLLDKMENQLDKHEFMDAEQSVKELCRKLSPKGVRKISDNKIDKNGRKNLKSAR